MRPEYHPLTGELVHEPWAAQGERLDAYLARRCPDRTEDEWYAECDANNVEVRDKFDLQTGTYTEAAWFLRWWNGHDWEVIDLDDGERPRMVHGFCHIVREGHAA